MSCDIDYRYRRALQPDGLTTYENALIAVNEAIADAKLAGRKPADCPGVRLLTRHLSRIAEGEETHRPDLDAHLREQCMTRVAELRHTPAIIALVRRGIDYRSEELRHYRREGSRTLRQVANQLGIDHTQYRLGYYAPNESMAGEHVMEASGLYVRISPERFGEPGVACGKRPLPCCATSPLLLGGSQGNSNYHRRHSPASSEGISNGLALHDALRDGRK